MNKELIETRADGVATLTLNRPDRLNALSAPIMDGLLEALPRLAGDPAVGAIVLTGAGRAFCAGGDVKRMAEETVPRNSEEDVARLRSRMEISRLLHEIPKPTIAMVNGAAAGAGLAMALACDMRIAGESARFVTAFAKVGFSGDFGGSYFLSKLVGTGKARELYFTAEALDASHALSLGIANRVVPDAELAETLRSIRVHGQGSDKYDNVRLGLTGRLDTIQAAILIEKLKIFEDEISARNRVAERYAQGLGNVVGIPRLAGGCTSVWAQYTIRLPKGCDRDAFAATLKAQGVPTAIYYSKSMHQQTAYRDFPVADGGLPVSEKLSADVISLPMHAYLEEPTQERIIKAVRGASGA